MALIKTQGFIPIYLFYFNICDPIPLVIVNSRKDTSAICIGDKNGIVICITGNQLNYLRIPDITSFVS